MWDVGLKGIGHAGAVTFLAAAGLTTANNGHVCKPSGNLEMDKCAAGDKFYGVITRVEDDGVLGVERKGYHEISYAGAINPGRVELVADGNGGVKAPATPGDGELYWVLSSDDAAKLLWLDLG